jgi:ArsR family transcriptional regulator
MNVTQRDPTAGVFRALADPTRVRIVQLLRGGALCVGDLVSVLRVPQPTASRHLAYLRRSGLVRDEKRGHWAFYALAPASGFQGKLLDALGESPSPQTRADRSALRALRRAGGCCPQHSRRSKGTDGRR